MTLNYFKAACLTLLITLHFSCNLKEGKSSEPETISTNTQTDTDKKTTSKIPVLNIGSFHFRFTPDAHKVEFNEEGASEQAEIRALNEMLAKFKPTIICVERTPENEAEINEAYQAYLKNHDKLDSNYGETSMVAFEIARLNGIKKIYGIDHQMGYNYNIGNEMVNSIDSLTYNAYIQNPFSHDPEFNVNPEELSLLDHFKLMNSPKYQDFLMNINADILTYVGSENGFEGADEATKLYQRNLRMFSNINRIPMKSTDRVFILSGGLHAAFIASLMKRSPKYELVDPLAYLK